jgi:hypothetical protein
VPSTRIVFVVVALAAALGGYLYWTSNEQQIRRLLDNVADGVSQEEGAGVTGLAEVAGLTRYFAPDVTLEPGEPFRAITGAADVVATVGRLRTIMATVQLDISDPRITVDGATGSVHAMVTLTLRDREGTQRVEMRDVLVALEKLDAGWVISAARAF